MPYLYIPNMFRISTFTFETDLIEIIVCTTTGLDNKSYDLNQSQRYKYRFLCSIPYALYLQPFIPYITVCSKMTTSVHY